MDCLLKVSCYLCRSCKSSHLILKAMSRLSRAFRLLGEDDALLVQEGARGVDGAAEIAKGEASALCLTIDSHSFYNGEPATTTACLECIFI